MKIKGTFEITVVLNTTFKKSRIQPVGKIVTIGEKALFLTSESSGSIETTKSEPVFLMHELSFIPEGTYMMSGVIKKLRDKNVWFFTPDNVKAFFAIFGREFPKREVKS